MEPKTSQIQTKLHTSQIENYNFFINYILFNLKNTSRGVLDIYKYADKKISITKIIKLSSDDFMPFQR